MLLKLGRDVALYKIYNMCYILMLLWQHAQFQSLPLQNQILPFATQDVCQSYLHWVASLTFLAVYNGLSLRLALN